MFAQSVILGAILNIIFERDRTMTNQMPQHGIDALLTQLLAI